MGNQICCEKEKEKKRKREGEKKTGFKEAKVFDEKSRSLLTQKTGGAEHVPRVWRYWFLAACINNDRRGESCFC